MPRVRSLKKIGRFVFVWVQELIEGILPRPTILCLKQQQSALSRIDCLSLQWPDDEQEHTYSVFFIQVKRRPLILVMIRDVYRILTMHRSSKLIHFYTQQHRIKFRLPAGLRHPSEVSVYLEEWDFVAKRLRIGVHESIEYARRTKAYILDIQIKF